MAEVAHQALPDLDRDSLGANFSYYNQISRLPGYRSDRYEGSRHEFVTGFRCVPSYRNQLPSLTGYPPFSPALPYYVDAWAEHIVGAPLIEEFSSLVRARITVFSRELSF